MPSSPYWCKSELLRSPLFAPLHDVIQQFDQDSFPRLSDLNVLLAKHHPHITVSNGNALRFVEQQHGKLSFEAQYEPRCYLTGSVSTRTDNWHDLLNALVWLSFPRAKAAINTRHYRAITNPPATVPTSPTSQRDAVRDAVTLLDESGVIVAYADYGLADHLRHFEWKELFWHKRQQVQAKMGFYLFGHGLYEKAMRPYIGMTGQGMLISVEKEFFIYSSAEQLRYLA